MLYAGKPYTGVPYHHQHSKSFQPFSSYHQQQQPYYMENTDYFHPQQQQQQRDYYVPQLQPPVNIVAAQAPVQPAATTGGVAAVLEYDMDQMTRFVCWLCYGLMRRTDTPTSSFNSLVKHVLSAIRLPKSTIILSLIYLSNRMELDSEPVSDDGAVFQNLTIALVLANKFHNDNTFTNKSWSDATGLNIQLINRLEREWLMKIGWKLHYEEGYQCLEDCWKTWCEKFSPQQQQLQQPVSPSSLFSDQFTPVHTPLNSPWFEETGGKFPTPQYVTPVGINPFGVATPYQYQNSYYSAAPITAPQYFQPQRQYQQPPHGHHRSQSMQPYMQMAQPYELPPDERMYAPQYCMNYGSYNPSYCTASAC